MKQKSGLLILLIILFATLVYAETPAKAPIATTVKPQIDSKMVPPSSSKVAGRQAIMDQAAEEAALEEARLWLNQLGYNLKTTDEVRNLKSLSAVGGTIERAQALTTENMRHLKVLKNLETLELAQFGNDDWVANAAGLVKLRSFVMSPASNLTDRSAAVFANMPELIQLMIHGCKITDAGFAKLTGLKKLKVLGLQYAPITDASMPIIGQNTDLENLTLSFTKITDAGLPHLYNLQKLQYFKIQSQTITPGAIGTLKTKLPNCKVVYP
ncbi:MAG: hypothetical protein M0036_15025 [Desulfobacteraceae bacterium]|nr:hypothetical protein [Desulfobacteraceae bacterium]